MPRRRLIIASDPIWPTDPRFDGKLIASLSFGGTDRTELWWLRLNHDQTSIVAAGRLIVPKAGIHEGSDAEERLPSVATTPDGGLALAFISRPAGETKRQLRLAPLIVDPVRKIPRVEESRIVTLAENRVTWAPAFSADGRWVYSFPRADRLPARAERSSVLEILARRPSSDSSNAPILSRRDRRADTTATAFLR